MQTSTRAQLQASAQQLREERADRVGKEQDAADAIALRDEAIQELKEMLAEEKVILRGTCFEVSASAWLAPC